MLRDIDNFYLQKQEPLKSCFQGLRDFILNYDQNFTESWKYGMPCFCYKSKPFCYLWTDKKLHIPYILMVEGRNIEHAALVQGSRSRMKILLIDPEKDLPVETIDTIFKMAMKLYNQNAKLR